jgi:glycosyltransferase involved in cell wall biosynthesis
LLEKLKRRSESKQPAFAVTFHTTEWGRAGKWPSSGESKEISEIEREGIARASAVIAVSRHVMSELDALYHPPAWKAKTIGHGVDPTPFERPDFNEMLLRNQLRWLPRNPALLFAGRLIAKNKPDLVLRAFAGALRNAEGIHALLAFAGDGPEKNTLANEAERLGAGGRVCFFPRLTGQGLADLYRLCALSLSPSDVFGAGALSAWAAARPAIAGMNSGSADVIWDGVNGWVLPLEESLWTETLTQAFRNPDRLQWMGRNGRAALETAFTWEAAARQTREVYGRKTALSSIN